MSVYLVRSLLLSLFIAIFITVCFYFFRKDLKFGTLIKFRNAPHTWSASFTVKASQTSFADQGRAFTDAVKTNLAITSERFRRSGIKQEGRLINDSTYTISVNSINDTLAVCDLITSNTRLSFHEVYSIADMAGKFSGMELEAGSVLVHIFQPAQQYNGMQQYPGYIGTCSIEDSGKLRSFFSSEKIAARMPPDMQLMFGKQESNPSPSSKFLLVYAIRKNADPLSNKHINHVEPTRDETNKPALSFTFDAAGTIRWERMTERNVGKAIAMVINDKVIFAPTVIQKITGGNSVINMGSNTGPNSEAAHILSALLTSQELLLPVTITESRFTSHTIFPAEALSPLMNYVLAFCASFAISFCIIWFAFRPGKKAGASPTDP
jgi:cbb3-type cytochrome oxidase subunit 3